jgi:hypothetical protein
LSHPEMEVGQHRIEQKQEETDDPGTNKQKSQE